MTEHESPMALRQFLGKVAVVTGSTSGIGLGIAQSLARAGASVVLNGFGDPSEIKSIVSDLSKTYKVPVTHVNADLTKPDEITQLIKTAEAFGQRPVDILVNNAGIQHVASVVDMPLEKWNLIVSLNLTAVFLTSQAVLPGMLSQGWGRIVNIASVHGLVGSSLLDLILGVNCSLLNKAPYVAAKHGVLGLTKVVGQEVAGKGVTCNSICPGWVLTPLVDKQIHARAAQKGLSYDDAKTDLVQEKQPSKQFVTVEHIGDTVVFLCSDAASQITGTHIAVDGGWTSQ